MDNCKLVDCLSVFTIVNDHGPFMQANFTVLNEIKNILK